MKNDVHRKIRNIAYMNSEASCTYCKRLSHRAETSLDDKEYAEYLHKLRIQDESRLIGRINEKPHKVLHFFLHQLMKISRIAAGIKVIKLNEKLPIMPPEMPVIFVITHVGKNDIAVFNEVVERHFTILSGDYESLHNNVEGFITALNGVLFFDMNSKTDRKSVESRVEQILTRGDNILCSMEAAWNLSPNTLCAKLFPGMIRCAIRSNAAIVPIGIERFNRKLYGINVGNRFFSDWSSISADDKEAILKVAQELRQAMAEAKFELYLDARLQPLITYRRRDIGEYDSYLQNFKNDILSEWTFTEKDIQSKRFHDKTEPEHAFSYISKRFERLRRSKTWGQSENMLFAELAANMKSSSYPQPVQNYLLNLYKELSEEQKNK